MGASCFKSDAKRVGCQGLCYDSVDLFRFDLFFFVIYTWKQKIGGGWREGGTGSPENHTSGIAQQWKVT